ncbi:MAG TPA: hypothetical protein VGM10_32580 [Actinocrinis sp.]
MSPRRNDPRGGRGGDWDRDRRGEPRDIEQSFGHQRIESAADGDWIVRSVTGAASAKTYRCPGCGQEIRPGSPHVVAWPTDRGGPGRAGPGWSGGGLEDRRHWHTPCWNARLRRR